MALSYYYYCYYCYYSRQFQASFTITILLLLIQLLLQLLILINGSYYKGFIIRIKLITITISSIRPNSDDFLLEMMSNELNTIKEEDEEVSNIMSYILNFQLEEMKNGNDEQDECNINTIRYNQLLKLLNDHHVQIKAVINNLSKQHLSILDTLFDSKKTINEIAEHLKNRDLKESESNIYSATQSNSANTKKKLKSSHGNKSKYKIIIDELRFNNKNIINSLPHFNSSKFDLTNESRKKHIIYILKAFERREKYSLSSFYYIDKDNKNGRKLYRRKIKEYIQVLLRPFLTSSCKWSLHPLELSSNVMIKFDRSTKNFFISETLI